MSRLVTAAYVGSSPTAWPKKVMPMFSRMSRTAANIMGSPLALFIAIALTIVWFLSGFFLHFSTQWQLIANTSTTIFTFLMVFLIQASQNQDTRALHIKIDELILSIEEADDDFVAAEKKADTVVTELVHRHEVIDDGEHD